MIFISILSFIVVISIFMLEKYLKTVFEIDVYQHEPHHWKIIGFQTINTNKKK